MVPVYLKKGLGYVVTFVLMMLFFLLVTLGIRLSNTIFKFGIDENMMEAFTSNFFLAIVPLFFFASVRKEVSGHIHKGNIYAAMSLAIMLAVVDLFFCYFYKYSPLLFGYQDIHIGKGQISFEQVSRTGKCGCIYSSGNI